MSVTNNSNFDDASGGKPDRYAVERRIVGGLGKLGSALRSIMWSKGQATGLTPTQAQILSLLAQRGPMRISAIAQDLGVRQPTATEAVNALVRKGLVSKSGDSRDKRAVMLTLTSNGRAEAKRTASWPDALLGAAGELDPAEKAALLRGLTTMIRVLQESGEISPARLCVTCRYFQPHVHADTGAPHHCALSDTPFGDRELRIDCADHEPVSEAEAETVWQRFRAGAPGTRGAINGAT